MKRCEVCRLDMHDEITLQSHLAGKRHFKNVHNIDANMSQKKVNGKTVIISNLPQLMSRENVINFLSQYGAINKYEFEADNVIVEFKNGDSTNALLKEPVWINKRHLNIQRTRFDIQKWSRRKEKKALEDASPINFNSLKHIFENNTKFNKQMTAFLNAIQLTESEIKLKYDLICPHLNEIFRSLFPKCQAYRFGSSQTGLGFKGSDLDIYMDIGHPVCNTRNASPNSWTTQQIFNRFKRIMYRMNGVFSNIVCIPRAKTPIIKFCYVQTGISCDISFKNNLGVHNSYLIKYYVSLDFRIKPVMLIIKYWAKKFNICGTGLIPNYSLILLIIFYLQQPTVGMLPTVTQLQETCLPRTVNGWQINFNDTAKLPPITNKSSIPQLIHGFFTYYANFTFKSNVICPLDGSIHTQSEFQANTLPKCMQRYKAFVVADENFPRLNMSHSMCIQDPIELNRNVTECTPAHITERFQKHCALGAEICELTAKDNYQQFLITLLTRVPPKSNNQSPVIRTFQMLILPMHFLDVGLPEDFDTRTDISDKEQYKRNNWCCNTFNIVKDIFEKVFKVHVEVFISDIEAKQQKVEMVSDVHTRDHKKIVLHCNGSSLVWRNRDHYGIILDPSLSRLEKEILASDKVVEASKNVDNSSETKLSFVCKFEKKQHNERITLTISNKETDNIIFKEFMVFAKQKVPKIVNDTLSYMRQYKKIVSYLQKNV